MRMPPILLRRMADFLAGSTGEEKPGICDMSLGIGTAMPYSWRRTKQLAYQTFAASNTGSTAYTFANIDIGPTAANRYVIVGVAGRTNLSTATQPIASVVMNGTTGTINVQASNNDITAGLVTGLVTDSTQISITVTFSSVTTSALAACSIDVWRAIGLGSATAAATTSCLTVPSTATFAGTQAGFGVALAANRKQITSWTGMTSENVHQIASGPKTISVNAADGLSSSFAVVGTYGGTGSTIAVAVFAAF